MTRSVVIGGLWCTLALLCVPSAGAFATCRQRCFRVTWHADRGASAGDDDALSNMAEDEETPAVSFAMELQESSPGMTRSQLIRGSSILAYGTLLGSTVTAESSPSYVNAVHRAINGAAPQAGLNVLEVGYGTGPNLETYPRGTRLMALDAQLQVGQGSDTPTHLRGLQEGWK